ncbi:hypothetical protein HELRODRAFT_99694 [Helobdella robusta]|uniref:Uncharacterized protein n=1 Tax=Helobdella robusta TaxID=6412 RepID=T1G9U5_HELRO|nr:hypothetical protein HELRODRAFT_99694 [Helobdella robusta]ESO04320.1 hypothetical protein HELRODRAFT_99694 [Helobdella robusta]
MHGKLILSFLLGLAIVLLVQADQPTLSFEQIKAKCLERVNTIPVGERGERLQRAIDYLVHGGARPATLPSYIDAHVSKLSEDEKQELAKYLESLIP